MCLFVKKGHIVFAPAVMEKNKIWKNRLVRKWGCLVLAVVSCILLLKKPVFNFPDEKGLEHNRTYIMTPHTFEVHHIEYSTGIDTLMGTMSVNWLFYGALAMLLGCVLCAVVYKDPLLRFLASTITAVFAGVYYLIMVYYAIRLSQKFFLMLYPNLIAFLPAVVLVTMLYIRKEKGHRAAASPGKEQKTYK